MSTRSKSPPTTAADTPRRAADRIRDTAFDLFYREGIRAIGVEEIVNRAGVTKPSLYRAYESKDELIADYLRDYDERFCRSFEAPAAEHPGDPKGQLLAYLDRLAARASAEGYRGCGLTNAVIEYPDPAHPAHQVAVDSKHALRKRLGEMCRSMGARDADELADSLLLLIEGSYVSGQAFGEGGPARALGVAARKLIDAAL
ncbi:TetR/AcrR family transcriptional regulator [Dyella mobilis]|uniref:TetR/AcrR family transcriptional regulator n=1 Tax=Dyella mobilis TaxID=1849582 RepID=A0ABS2KF69_9GAMM|nr:TetR/AcrR family transcriptional regulator [Dyella mobilis]MBM7129816.1 TetR/AcrR family transcriptional regulator [Dyella mobilis]GLQ97921.1 TetR family transcriptional regulator [Dyella mobilis]